MGAEEGGRCEQQLLCPASSGPRPAAIAARCIPAPPPALHCCRAFVACPLLSSASPLLMLGSLPLFQPAGRTGRELRCRAGPAGAPTPTPPTQTARPADPFPPRLLLAAQPRVQNGQQQRPAGLGLPAPTSSPATAVWVGWKAHPKARACPGPHPRLLSALPFPAQPVLLLPSPLPWPGSAAPDCRRCCCC